MLIAAAGTLSQCKSPLTPGSEATNGKADSSMAKPGKAASKDSSAAPGANAEDNKNESDTTKRSVQIPLTLVIKNLESTSAPVVVGLYNPKSKFPDPKGQLKEYHFKPHGNELRATITDQKFGDYAMAIYQDVNSNGKIDKNLVGIPTEPYAFSDNYVPKVKAPSFDNCKFSYNAKNNTVTMTMLK
jgi:uncharacterized protein (DUF2141 family)